MKTLIYYEKRKILRRKSTIIACLLMLLSIIALSFVFVSDQDHYRADGTEVSGMEAIHVKQEMNHTLAGPLTAERLKDALQQYHTVYGNSDNFGASGTLKDEVYCKDTGAAAFKAEESKMSDTVLQIMQPTNPVEPPYQYMMIDGCKVKVNYLPKPSAPSAGKVLDRIHEILLASRLKK